MNTYLYYFSVPLAGLLLLAGCNPESEQPTAVVPLKPNVSAPATPEAAEANQPAEVNAADNQQGQPQQPQKAPADRASQAVAGGSNPGRLKTDTTGSKAVVPPSIAVEPASDVPLAEAIPEYETPLWKPTVVMSQAHANTCKVQVGDLFPALPAQTLAGEAIDTGEVLKQAFEGGHRLAVIVLWDSSQSQSKEQYSRLGEELIAPFSEAGVQVIALHIGGTEADVQQVSHQPQGAFVNLIDPSGEAFQQLATEKLPRTYVVDREGRVLWFDIEYSSGTRRDLRNALMVYLSEHAEAGQTL